MDRFPVAVASQSALALADAGLPLDVALTMDWKQPTCLKSAKLQLNFWETKAKTFPHQSSEIIVCDQTTD